MTVCSVINHQDRRCSEHFQPADHLHHLYHLYHLYHLWLGLEPSLPRRGPTAGAPRASPTTNITPHTLHGQEPILRIPKTLNVLASTLLFRVSWNFQDFSSVKTSRTWLFYIQTQERSFFKITWLQKSGISNVNIWKDMRKRSDLPICIIITAW